jgi:hypothetical protein
MRIYSFTDLRHHIGLRRFRRIGHKPGPVRANRRLQPSGAGCRHVANSKNSPLLFQSLYRPVPALEGVRRLPAPLLRQALLLSQGVSSSLFLSSASLASPLLILLSRLSPAPIETGRGSCLSAYSLARTFADRGRNPRGSSPNCDLAFLTISSGGLSFDWIAHDS